MTELVFKGQNDQVLTNSLLVAEKFGKEHKHVLDAIRELIQGCAETSADPMFVEAEVGRLFTSITVAIRNTNKKTMKTIDKLEIILQKMEEQNNRLEQIYGKHLKLIVCTGKRSEKVKFKHED